MSIVRSGARRVTWAATAAAVVALVVVPGSEPVVAAPTVTDSANIVYVVVDDLSSNIVPYMSEVVALAETGVSFDQFFVTDAQCCPSRASTLTGMYPHNSGVLTNGGPDGGFRSFAERHLDTSMGPLLSAAGYRTGFIGKFLNGYRPGGSQKDAPDRAAIFEPGYVPPGWDEWHVVGDGYREFNYTMATAIDEPVATVEKYGHQPDDYLTDVLSDKTAAFLDRAATSGEPFFLTVAPFAVHGRVSGRGAVGSSIYPPAPRDRALTSGEDAPRSWPEPDYVDGDCGDIVGGCAAVPFPAADDLEAFNKVPANGHRWMPSHSIDERTLEILRERYLDRIRMAQAVDDLIGDLRADLDRLGLADDTYIVFTSDNGYHLGEHGLRQGKNSAFDHDVRVPMIVVPPGGGTAAVVPAMAQNTDLLPTFLEIAGQPADGPAMDGGSLLPLIDGAEAPRGWREGALIGYTSGEHDGRSGRSRDPDADSQGSPPTYQALRTAGYLYVDYGLRQGVPRARDAELYDLVRDPAATVNRYAELARADRQALDRALERYAACSGASCERAARRLPAISTTR